MLEDLDLALNAEGISLAFARLKDPVRRKIDRYELTRTIDPNHFFPTLADAIGAFQARRAPSGSLRRDQAVCAANRIQELVAGSCQ
jgi:hypothetical protein